MKTLTALRRVDESRFIEEVNQKIKSRGISVRAAAQLCGIDHTSLWRILKGHRQPSLNLAIRISKGLTTNYYWKAQKRDKASR